MADHMFDLWPTLLIGPPVHINQMSHIRWSHSQSCPSRISFGNIYNSRSQGVAIDHKAVMMIDCFLPEGHDGPHTATLDTLDSPNNDTGSIADHKFTLTWED